jgi:protein-S-isoprenylcysteine O-methyltransferase Ste14
MNNLYLRAFRAMFGGAIVFLALIFIPAWTLDYWQGWVFFGTFMVSLILITIWMALHDKELLERRLNVGPAAEKTRAQQIFTALGIPVYVASVLVMVFDHRFGWSSPAVPTWLSLVGDALGALGILIYFLVIRKNRFAAATVEVAEGQTVVSTGPYAIVRHPMYAGAVLFLIGEPLALGSWWGLLCTLIFIAGFTWRSLNEEEFLRANLRGYAEYCRKVRYRIVPYIW